jgi:hypothetical protein
VDQTTFADEENERIENLEGTAQGTKAARTPGRVPENIGNHLAKLKESAGTPGTAQLVVQRAGGLVDLTTYKVGGHQYNPK